MTKTYTTSFPPDVERWRTLAREKLLEILEVSATYQTMLYTLDLSNEDIVNVVLGIIQKESSGNPDAIGDNGNSIGLMQLNYGVGTPQEMGFEGLSQELLKPDVNIFYGELYFLKQLHRYNDLQKAVSAYNAGHAIAGNMGVYVDKVLSFLSEKKT